MAERDYAKEVMTSELAYRILWSLQSEEGLNPSGIADKIDSSSKTVSNYLNGLKTIGIVEKSSKKGRKIFYKINYDRIASLHTEIWNYRRKIFQTEISDNLEISEKAKDKDLDLDIPEEIPALEEKEIKEIELDVENKEDFRQFIRAYVSHHLGSLPDSTIENMLVNDFVLGVLSRPSEEKQPDWLVEFLHNYRHTIMFATSSGGALRAFNSAMKEMKK